MRPSFLYRLARVLIRAVVTVYFRSVEVVGLQQVPTTGAMILAANHPQSAMDPLILGLHIKRMVNFLAFSGAFNNKLQGWFLRNAGVIPVFRPHDVTDAAARNVDTFSACYDVLEQAGAIGIFPEGTSLDDRRLQPLKTGTARIALQVEAANDWSLGLRIVPAGLNFEEPKRFRSRVLVFYAAPLVAADYRDAYEKDPVQAVNQLTADLADAIRACVVNVPYSEFEELVQQVEDVYSHELIGRADVTVPGDTRFQKSQKVSREIGKALDYFYQHKPIVVWRVQQRLREYRGKLGRLRLRDDILRDDRSGSMPRAALRFVVTGLLGLPFALYGAVTNIIPYRTTHALALQHTSKASQIHYARMGFGFIIYIIYYGLILWWGNGRFAFTNAALLVATMPVTGMYALGYFRRMAKRRRMLRFAYLQVAKGYLVQDLRNERRRLIAEMDAALDAYLLWRAQSGENSATSPEPPA